MQKRSLAVLAAAASTLALVAPVGAQSTDTSSVYVVHGVPGVPVDVYVDGALTLEDFQPAAVAGPLTLPAKDYRIQVFAAAPGATEATAATRTDAVVIDETETVPGGVNVSVVAHWADATSLALTPFVNDVSAASVPNGRLEIRHAAAAPEVDIVAAGAPVAPFVGLSTGDSAKADLPAGDYPTGIAAANTTAVLVPAPVTVKRGAYSIVYAVGRFGNDFTLISQEIGGIYLSGAYSGSSGLEGSVARLYVAVLGRQPDAAGFQYWLGVARQGNGDLIALVHNMAVSSEFSNRFGDSFGGSNAEWVEHLYDQVLGRGSDTEGKAYWTQLLDSGSLTKEGALLYFSESAEYRILTGSR